jgi:hypothetical protein
MAALLVAVVRRPDFELQLNAVMVVLLSGSVLTLVLLVADLVRPAGVDLRPDAIVVHGRFRRREFAWHDVTDVRVDRRRGAVLELAGGEEVVLGYPSRGLLPPFGLRRFDADHRRIREWWLAHREPVVGA